MLTASRSSSSRSEMSGTARRQSRERAVTDSRAEPHTAARSLIRAREISWATELLFMPMISAISA